MAEIVCEICPRHCHIPEGRTGFCRARKNEAGTNIQANYGRITSLAVDPIEKKPLYGFCPGSRILSVGSYGCNMDCPFCQNASISAADENTTDYITLTPEELTDIACHHPESIGIAFTYNEPMTGYEYIIDTAKLLRRYDLKTVLVTNGCVSPQITEKLLPYVDAMNIDLKGDRQFYRELGGDYDTVKETIRLAASQCHVEVTTLLIPGKNDDEAFIRNEASWLASLDQDIILHLSRYFPRRYYTIPPTDPDRMKQCRRIAKEYLHHVYLGNI